MSDGLCVQVRLAGGRGAPQPGRIRASGSVNPVPAPMPTPANPGGAADSKAPAPAPPSPPSRAHEQKLADDFKLLAPGDDAWHSSVAREIERLDAILSAVDPIARRTTSQGDVIALSAVAGLLAHLQLAAKSWIALFYTFVDAMCAALAAAPSGFARSH